MLYNFICPNCKNKKQVSIPLEKLEGLEVICNECQTKMRRDWKAGISIASNDKAENVAETSWVKESLKKRPSGKTQVFY